MPQCYRIISKLDNDSSDFTVVDGCLSAGQLAQWEVFADQPRHQVAIRDLPSSAIDRDCTRLQMGHRKSTLSGMFMSICGRGFRVETNAFSDTAREHSRDG